MYETFYGFTEKPFNATPDPKFLFMTPSHREALAHLIFGVQEQRGFLVLTGEVGTGKTTLLNTLLRQIDDTTRVAFIHNSTLSFDEILEYILKDFGIADPGASRVQRLMALNGFLLQRRRAGLKTVLLFDEAQNLEVPILEQVRLLSNFETATDKLVQILLVGQPELKAKLALPQLRQLKQRVGLRCSIRPLTAEETKEYIRARLRIAGAQDLKIFEDRAVQSIAQYSGGIPRVINMVCDHCLVTGYAMRRRRIDRSIVERAIAYLEEGEQPEDSPRSLKAAWRWLIGTMAASTAAGAIFLTVHAARGVSLLDVARAAKAWLLP